MQKNIKYQHLEPIGGMPVLWQKSEEDLFAFIRTLGIPTFFCSISAADRK